MTAFVTSLNIAPLVKEVRGNTEEISFPSVVSNIYDVEEGSLFVPRKDHRYDGHQFIEAAMEGGAAGALWHIDEPVPATMPENFPLFLTDSPERVCSQLSVLYLQAHRAHVVFLEGDYTASIILRMLKAWTHGKKTAVITEQETRQVSTAEVILSVDVETDIIFVEALKNNDRMHELAKMLKPEIALISYYTENEMLRSEIEEGKDLTLKTSIVPSIPDLHTLDLPEWLESYRPLVETAAQAYHHLTGHAHPPLSFLSAETFGYQTMSTNADGIVLFEAEPMELANLDYALGWLSHLEPYKRRVIVIDEGFQSDRYHKAVHELFAEHLNSSITDVFAVGEKAFWVYDVLKRSERESPVPAYYRTHIDAIEDLREVLSGPNVLMYKGANRELIYQILYQLDKN